MPGSRRCGRCNEIFHLLGILLLRVIVFVWFARPPFAAKVGGAAGGH